MVEISLLVSTSLLLVTAGFLVIYFRRMKEIGEEYNEAKNILSDIILSFKGDLQRHEDMIHSISEKMEGPPSRDENSKKIEELRIEVTNIKNELKDASDKKRELSTNVDKLNKDFGDLLLQQKESLKRISELEQETKHTEPLALDRIEAAFPIRREKALARLTQTELMVLEILANEGEKTASQIKDEIRLTREHTARLMKSLHSRGYVERATEKLPYVYRIKEEMMKILRRNESATS